MKSFLTYRIAATLQLLTFFFIAVFAFDPTTYARDYNPPDAEKWPGFFSLPVIFLMIITLINDGTLISIGYDHATPSKSPERWVLPILFVVASALGAIACLSSLLLLYFCLTSWDPHGVFGGLGIGGLKYGQIVNVIFLKVAVSDILTLFSSRTAHLFFFQRKPHLVLFVCTVLALCLSTTLSLVWPCGTLDEVPVCGLGYHASRQKIALWVWLYCIVGMSHPFSSSSAPFFSLSLSLPLSLPLFLFPPSLSFSSLSPPPPLSLLISHFFLVFFIQDVVKVGTWRFLMYFNFFNVNNKVKSHDDLGVELELLSHKHH